MSDLLIDLLPDGFNDLSVMDKDILAIYGVIKAVFPKIYVNAINGERFHNYCGWRPQECCIGASKSAHKLGRALDLHYPDLSELREWIFKNGVNHGITRMEAKENTPVWVHIDNIALTPEQRERSERIVQGIYVFKP